MAKDGIFVDKLIKGRTSMTSSGMQDARDWYREKAREVSRVNPTQIINANPEYQKSTVLPGYMYLFGYDAKNKDTLPFWDKFPLIFPFHIDGDSILGMNLHYLPHLYRARLMDALYNLASNRSFDEKTKLRMSYNLLNGSAKYKYFRPCVKRYLKGHLKSRFLLIPSNEWDIAMFLPLERFTVNKSTVFRETTNAIRKAV
jgi:hypothetical protein